MIDYSSTSCGSETGSNHSCTKPPGSAAVRSDGALGIEGLRLLRKLGSGDIGSVYLAELKYAVGCKYAAKVMDKEELVSRNKEERARREKEILEMLDHPFLPSLYASLESQRWVCLLTEFCPGGDLHLLRQRQKGERFDEPAVRFYASEVVAALEYIHMLGIVYRDLKPENVLVRSDGHIMLTDFDLSLKCDNPTSVAHIVSDPLSFATTSCAIPNCIVPAISCFNVTLTRKHSKKPLRQGAPTFVAEPINVRSMSFVGTHEYLAPEIVSGEGHGSAVDWWTLGIFLYELSYGVTPFKGSDNEVTLANIVARGLEFPKDPTVVGSIKELIAALLVKNPAKRMGSTMGASAIKHHPFFYGVNWALLRCATPPYVPSFANRDVCDESYPDKLVEYY